MTSNSARTDFNQRKREREKLISPELYVATLEGVRTPEQDLIEQQEWQELDHLVDRLRPPRLGLAFRYRYGIRCKPMTLREIAEKFGCSKERVRQLNAQAERILRRWVLLEKNPKLLREILAAEEAEERAKRGLLNEEHARQRAAWRYREGIERDAQRAAEHERYRQQNEQLAFAAAYQEALELNRHWKQEVERRERVVRQQENAKKRREAFNLQARNLKAAYGAYYASIGTPAEHYCYVIYAHLTKDWGPAQSRIWKEFPYD